MVDHPTLLSADLERLLKLSPDEYWDVGQVVPRWSERCYQFSRWALREHAGSLDELAEVVQVLAHRIQGIEQNFHLLPKDSTVSLTLFVTETDTVIGMGINAEVIKLLARIEAGVEISLVIDSC